MSFRDLATLSALAVTACSARELGPSRVSPTMDGPLPGVPVITVTTVAPSSSLAPGRKATATWAAYRKEDGSWAKLADPAPAAPNAYTFQTRADRWAVVFACAAADSSLVAFHEDAVAVTSLEL